MMFISQTFVANLSFNHSVFAVSRYDLLHVSNGVDNNTLLVRTGELGHTVLKVRKLLLQNNLL